MNKIIRITLAIAVFFIFYKANVEKTFSSTEVSKKISNNENKISLYFPQKEIEIITNAAKRNNCTGEDLIILLSIRKSENGSQGNEFGSKCPKHINTNLDGQAACAAVTIMNNRIRWKEAGEPGDFISFLGGNYCPTTGELTKKEQELNKNWIPNVKDWVKKLSG